MKRSNLHPIEKIHSIHHRFNAVFSAPLYFIGAIVSGVLLISPYWQRMLLAFLVNALFNRPAVYFSYFAEFVGKRMNRLIVSIFYVLIFGAYSLWWRIVHFRVPTRSTNWISKRRPVSENDYLYQS